MKFKYLIILVIIFVVLLSGCIDIDSNNNSSNKSFKYYKIKIIPNNLNNYTIYIPIAYINPTKPSKLMDQFPDTIKQIDTEYGKALKIEYNGNFTLFHNLTEYEPETLLLSMREIKEIDNKPTLFIWIYCNSTDFISLSLELYSEIDDDNGFIIEKEWCDSVHIQKNGWYQIQMKTEASGD